MDFMRGFIPKSLKILQNQNRSKAPEYEPRLRINIPVGVVCLSEPSVRRGEILPGLFYMRSPWLFRRNATFTPF
jgi:hypothetical protein